MLKKIKHQYGRHYGAYLTPVEFLELVKNDGIMYRKSNVLNAKNLKEQGLATSQWYYFDISENSLFYKKLKGNLSR